jgi:hypothetical protein
MQNFLTAIGTVIGVFLIIAVLMGLPLMILWNWLMPHIFNLPEIGFWQAVGINFLCSVMFKSTSSNTKD